MLTKKIKKDSKQNSIKDIDDAVLKLSDDANVINSAKITIPKIL